jgi:hypothetical protein
LNSRVEDLNRQVEALQQSVITLQGQPGMRRPSSPPRISLGVDVDTGPPPAQSVDVDDDDDDDFHDDFHDDDDDDDEAPLRIRRKIKAELLRIQWGTEEEINVLLDSQRFRVVPATKDNKRVFHWVSVADSQLWTVMFA